MGKYYKWKVLLIIAAVAYSLWSFYPPSQKINMGLDLQGGMQLVLEVDAANLSEDAREDATDRVVEIIRNRIDEFGVREPVITKQGSLNVVVQLPGVTDRERAKEIVGKTAHLEFKLVSNDTSLATQAEQGKIPEGYEYKEVQDAFGSSKLLLDSKALLTGEHLTKAWVGFGQMGEATVQLQFDHDGAKLFDQITFQNIGRQLAIVLDGKVHSAPVIRDRIPNGQGVISGNFTPEEASDLSLILRAGALPAPVKIIEERTVGSSLGQDSVQKGVYAGLIGTLLVFVFMPIYYLLPGVVAVVGLFLYGLFLLGSLAAFGASLTLPGIAGFVLSIGMAVDANVLIFERIREEKEAGKTSRGAIAAGYHKAFSAILDSNLTTILTSVILFIFGTGPIKGFAVTLTLGIIASMFSAIFITRVLFDFLSHHNANLNLKMMKIIGVTHFAFLKGRVLAYGFSFVVLALGVVTILYRGNENLGVEFTGGTLAQIQFAESVDIADLRGGLEKAGLRGAVIQHYGDRSDNQFIIKVAEPDTEKIEAVAGQLASGKYQLQRVDRIGASVSDDLTKKALVAVALSSLGILIYVGWRFEWKFAFAAVVALIHDTVFTFGVYSLSGREINLPTIAAILTIMGYSVNDTIVTFDRVRDNMKLMRRAKFEDVVNLSINQTLSRTILTSLTVILTTLALFLFGGAAINDFAFTMLIGFFVGIYSTIFVANSIIVDMKAR
ncbi:MAG: protein translocase subunit SecD [Candidatus Omnitrophica bacterium]|nr:protein translocase subunit SecD [Candidatus Omnitrophota bacterium]